MKKSLVAVLAVLFVACGGSVEEQAPAQPAATEQSGAREDWMVGLTELTPEQASQAQPGSVEAMHTHSKCGGPYYYCNNGSWYTYDWCCGGHSYNMVRRSSCNVTP